MMAELKSDKIVPVKAMPVSPVADCEVSDNKSSVAMSISTAGLEFKLDTVVDHSRETIELAAKLELALTLLSLSENKLEQAMIKIGDLQRQLKQAEGKPNEP